MDPRKPEEAVERMAQLMNHFRNVLDRIRLEKISSKLGEAEREGGLVVQEICLVAPRLHEAMMQESRNRRAAISRGLINIPVENSAQSVKKEAAEVEQSVIKTEKSVTKTKSKKKSSKKKKAD